MNKLITLHPDQLIFLLNILDDAARDFYTGEMVGHTVNLKDSLIESVTDANIVQEIEELKARVANLEKQS